uniref:LRRCT domain-containing protein n=1 Tax=Photinus pyralis TaxID=7054 RepID=A0A1Y1MT41_PHOPY
MYSLAPTADVMRSRRFVYNFPNITMSTLLLSILGLTLGAPQCSILKDIAPCKCSNETYKIEITCEKMTSYDHLVNTLRDKFLPTEKIVLEISSSSLHDLPQRSFKELNLNIKNLQLHHDNLTSLSPSSFMGLPQVKFFSLSDNNIGVVPEAILETLPHISSLNLGRCGIQYITDRNFKSLPNLDTLMLGGNQISQMDSNSLPKNVIHLHLGRNKIKDLNGTLTNLTNLEWFFINCNELTTLEDQLPLVAPNVILVHAGHNKIEKLPQHLKTYTGLLSLFVNNNRLTSLDGVISRMKKLERAQFEYNRISTLTKEDFLETESLDCLCLGNNLVTSLNNSLSPLKGITILNLTHNLLTDFSLQEIKGLMKLRIVDLSHNKISTISGPTANLIEWETKITVLLLNNNELTTLNGALSGLPSLLTINLSHNKITSISPDDLVGLDRLEVLNISHNNLTTLEETGKTVLPSLNELIASHNSIKILNQDFHGLPVLCWADLSNNQIVALGRDLVRNTRCKEQYTWGTLKILLQNNPILCDAALPEIVASMEVNHTRISGVSHCAPLNEQPTTAKPNGYLGFVPEHDINSVLNTHPTYQQPIPYAHSHHSQNELVSSYQEPKDTALTTDASNPDKQITPSFVEPSVPEPRPNLEQTHDSTNSNNVKPLDDYASVEVSNSKHNKLDPLLETQITNENAQTKVNEPSTSGSGSHSIEKPLDPVAQQKQLDKLTMQIEQLRLQVEELTVQNKILSHTINQSVAPITENNKTEHIQYEEVAIHTLPNDEPYLDKVKKLTF